MTHFRKGKDIMNEPATESNDEEKSPPEREKPSSLDEGSSKRVATIEAIEAAAQLYYTTCRRIAKVLNRRR